MADGVEIIRNEDRLLALQPEWNALWARNGIGSPFTHFDWVWLGWQRRALRRPQSLYVAILRQDGRLVAALPLMAYAHLLLGRAAVSLRSRLPDDRDVLVEPGADAPAYLARLLEGLHADWRLWRVRLDLGHQADLVEAAAQPYLRTARTYAEAAICDFADGFEAYYATRSNQLRVVQRRNIRRLERQGPVSFWRADSRSLDADLDWLLHRKRLWTPATEPLHPWLGSMETENDLRRICHLWMGRGWVWLNMLKVGDLPVAAGLSFVPGRLAVYYVLAYDPAYAYYSPGLMLTIMLQQRLAEAGVKTMSLMGGTFDWKARLASRTLPLRSLTLLG